MNIYLSSATLQSYENKNKSMDLFYNPIVIFEDIEPFMIEQLKDIKWSVTSSKIGTYIFDILMIKNGDIKQEGNICFVEFRLARKDISFEYDNYLCEVEFSATFESLDNTIPIKYKSLAIVKTKWTKGLV
jgi:hypothetical protein